MDAGVLLSPMCPVPARRIHVLEVVGNAIVGGMETCVERLVEHLPAEHFAVSVLCPFDGVFARRLRQLGAEVWITAMPEDLAWSSLQRAIQLVESRQVDVLHAHLPNAHLLAAIAAKMTGRPVMTTIHGRQLSVLDLELHRLVQSHISVVCQESYFHALGLGVPATRLSLDPNGVDAERFVPRPRCDPGLRAHLGLEASTPLVAFVGRLSPEKGPEIFVRMLLSLGSRYAKAHGVMVGDGPMRPALQAQIAQLGLAQRVHLLGEQPDMPGIYSEIDVLVLSSHSEAMPLVVMEAMACGIPVVATRVGGVPDILPHGEAGWLVKPGDFEDMAGRCANLLADVPLRQNFGASARRRVLEGFDLRQSTARLADRLRLLALSAPARKPGAVRPPPESALRSDPGDGHAGPVWAPAKAGGNGAT